MAQPEEEDATREVEETMGNLAIHEQKLPTLALALSNTMGEYHGAAVSPKHILDWVQQPSFSVEDREFVLEELDHVFTRSFLTVLKLTTYLTSLKLELESKDPTFWSNACLVQLQAEKKSQGRMNKLFVRLFPALNMQIESVANVGEYKNVVYLDDALYTGQSLYNSLTRPEKLFDQFNGRAVHVCVVFMHAEAEKRWGWTKLGLMKGGATSAELHRGFDVGALYSSPISNTVAGFFSTPGNRVRLHNIFSEIGAKKFKFDYFECKFAPMGISSGKIDSQDKINLSTGFGSPVATCSNCPNNAPTVLWWKRDGWLPLLPRVD